MATYTLYGVMPADKTYESAATTYSAARNATNGVTERSVLGGGLTRVENSLSTITYYVQQTGYRYDLSTVVGPIAAATLVIVPENGPSSGGPHSVRVWYNALTGATESTALFLTGTQLDSTTAATSAVAPTLDSSGTVYNPLALEITTPSLLTTTGFAWFTLVHGNTANNITPSNFNYLAINTHDAVGTIDDPYMLVRSGHTVRDTGNPATTISGNLAVPYPPVIAANDALVVSLAAADNIVSTMPVGWTLESAVNNGTTLRNEVWWARAAGSETGSVTVTRTSGLAATARMIAVTGGNVSGDPIAAVHHSANASSTTVTTGSAASVPDGVLAAIVAVNVAAAADLSANYDSSQSASGWSSAAYEEFDDGVEPRAYLAASVAANNAGGATTLSFVVPSNAAAGDVLIVWVTVRGTTTTVTRISPEWTLHDSLSHSVNAITRLLWYVIPASGGDQPGNTIAFTLGTSQKASGAMAVMRNANTTTPFNASARQANASSVSCAVPTITPSASATFSLVYGGTAIGTTANVSPTSGFSPVTYSLVVQGASGANQTNTRTTSALYAPSPTTTTGRQISGSAIDSGVVTFGAAAVNVGWQVAVASATPTARAVEHGVATFNVSGTSIAAQTATLQRSAVNIGTLIVFAAEGSGTAFTASIAASLSSISSVVDRTGKVLLASSTAIATNARNSFRNVAASISTSAAVSRRAARTIAAVLTGSASTAETVTRRLTASVTSAGSVVRRAAKVLVATLTASTAVARSLAAARSLSASVSGTTTLSRIVARPLTAVITATTAVQRSVVRLVTAAVLQAAEVTRRTDVSEAASLSGTAALAQSRQVFLTPDGTVSNTGWTPVNAATIHDALAASDTDYIRSTAAGSVTEVTMTDPVAGFTFTAGQFTIRVRLG